MTLTQKGKTSKKEILDVAILDFSQGSYTEISLNQFCKNNRISKGHFYYYFESKEDLYIESVQETYNLLVHFIENHRNNLPDNKQSLSQYLDARYMFGKEYPDHSRLFIRTRHNVPEVLQESINKIKQELLDYNLNYFRVVLENETLREGLTVDNVLQYYLVVNDAFDAKFHENKSIDIDKHFHDIEMVINMMMFGTIERGK
ncbi:MAG: TetR/AcrR family transcriptional regulator [Erysipelothrix sp.]